jgi:DNA-binding LacI/PurR family transcriptional regulator
MNLPNEGAAPAPGGGLPNFGRVVKTSGGPMKPITMASIAKAAGVSQGAISSLLNDRDYGIRVSEKTRERVFKVCRELGYIPNDLRAVVRMYPELGDVCLLISTKTPGGLANPFVSKIAGAVLGTATQGSLVTAFYDEAHEYTGEGVDLPKPIQNGTASKFLWIGAPNLSLAKVIHRRAHPLAVIGHETRQTGTTSVVPDYVAAARTAFEHFAQHGHKTIAIVGGPFGSPEPRFADLNRALGIAAQELGLSIDSQAIFHGDLTFEAGAHALDALLTRNPDTSAVFTLSEAAACGVMARAHAKTIGVPAKLSVLALADHDRTPPSCIPVSTVAMPMEQLAVAAVNEIERQIREGLPLDAHRIVLGVKLCERSSVGPRQ